MVTESTATLSQNAVFVQEILFVTKRHAIRVRVREGDAAVIS